MAQQVSETFNRGNRILRRREVEHLVGLSRSAIYRRIAEGHFPPPVPIGEGKAVGWLSGEIEDFVRHCIAAREQKAAQ